MADLEALPVLLVEASHLVETAQEVGQELKVVLNLDTLAHLGPGDACEVVNIVEIFHGQLSELLR